MRAAVLNIGDEVLLGHTVNTNLSLIAKTIWDYGILIDEQVTVRDEKNEIIEAFCRLFDKYDMIFTSGGLGPTADDITTECIADALGRDLVLNEDVLKKLEYYFISSGRKMTENNKKQAVFPRDSEIINNDFGTAAGYFLREQGKWVIVLPGPPIEVKNILNKFLNRYKTKEKISIRIINTQGIGESALEDRLRKLDLNSNYAVNTYFGGGGVDIKIVSEDRNGNEMQKLIDTLTEEFKENIYDYDSDSISKSLLKKLIKNNKTVAFAESCTGGNVSIRFIENPDASRALICSLVTYSDESKIKELNVKAETLKEHTAVSKEVAMEMLEGLKNKYSADYYAITTGYASPTEDKRTNGLVYIGIYDRENDKTIILEEIFVGTRMQIIDRVTNYLFFNIIKLMG
ncbi:MAG: CinA family nicotinamide mononucleotide deamidase-related protein [Tissierellia bacterium]|jgi:nicotinamide-nucleotide amidase|nr:CinA family nicotinamide mononucleotide deamidase-related protein [Tissierellia bacterium]